MSITDPGLPEAVTADSLLPPDNRPDQTAHLNQKRVVVAMSGGVDSSVSAWLLREAGYEVIGATLRLHDRADKAVHDAASICEQLGIDHFVLDWRDAFDRLVLQPFAADYLSGRTPNPCIFCNPEIKFRAMLELADTLGAARIATGHYVRVSRHPLTGRLAFSRARHGQKDQSYFLYRLTQEQLGRLLLPISELEKPQVRAIAREAGLKVGGDRLSAEVADSQDICFIETDYVTFLRDYAVRKPEWLEALKHMDSPGPVLDPDGVTIGSHSGLLRFTPGQRRGFETRSIERHYVLGTDPGRNALIVGTREQAATDRFIIENLAFSGFASVDPTLRLDCRIRNTATATAGTVHPLSDNRWLVTLEKPVHAPAAGQSAVFYDGDIIVFGGLIVGRAPTGTVTV